MLPTVCTPGPLLSRGAACCCFCSVCLSLFGPHPFFVLHVPSAPSAVVAVPSRPGRVCLPSLAKPSFFLAGRGRATRVHAHAHSPPQHKTLATPDHDGARKKGGATTGLHTGCVRRYRRTSPALSGPLCLFRLCMHSKGCVVVLCICVLSLCCFCICLCIVSIVACVLLCALDVVIVRDALDVSFLLSVFQNPVEHRVFARARMREDRVNHSFIFPPSTGYEPKRSSPGVAL